MMLIIEVIGAVIAYNVVQFFVVGAYFVHQGIKEDQQRAASESQKLATDPSYGNPKYMPPEMRN